MIICKCSWYMNAFWPTPSVCLLDGPVLTEDLLLLVKANGLLNLFILIDRITVALLFK